MFGFFKKKPPPPPSEPRVFPPVPRWKPEFAPPIERVIDRVAYYTDGERDFAVFRHGTCALLPKNGLDEAQAASAAKEILDQIYNYHPDMNPTPMDDGNILVQYNHPALNVVLEDFVQLHWQEIERNHLDALATHEVLMTPRGPNKFDPFGMKALFGRCFMFMDAQSPEVIRVVRAR
ncbi:MAG: hypothetical protein R3A52_32915 [Polyangiales bacterium]